MYSSCNILLVDDNENNLFTLESILHTRFDSKIIKVQSGEEALAYVLENSVDIILLDIQMPGMSGFEVATYLKKSEKTKNIPILFLTAVYKEDEFQAQGFEIGAIDYLTKPINDNLLLNRLNLYLALIEKEKQLTLETQKSRQKDLIIAQNAKFSAIGEVVNNIAHHWRQPLNALSLTIQDLVDAHRFGELSENYLQSVVNNSLKHINGMSKTIDDFLHFFNSDTKKVDVNILTLLVGVVGVVKTVYENFDIDLKVVYRLIDGSEEECTIDELLESKNLRKIYELIIFCQEANLKRALLGILENAKDVLLKKESNRKITLLVESKENIVDISVCDNGGGVPVEIIDKIFEPYYTTKEVGKGSGIGLYMAKMIVESNLDGKLKVTNDVEGAKFTITVPREDRGESK